MIRVHFGAANHILSVIPLLCVRRCCTVGEQRFLSSMVGVAGSARLLRWLGMGRHWQWNAPCLQVRRPPTAPLLKQSRRGLCTSHTDGIKGMCEQHERHREFKVGTLCLQGCRRALSWRANEQILFVGFLMQTKRPMYEHTDMTHTEHTRALACSCSTCLVSRIICIFTLAGTHTFLLELITYTQRHILQCQGVHRYTITQRQCSCPMVR